MSAFLGVFSPAGHAPGASFQQMLKAMAGPHLDVPVQLSDENSRVFFAHFAQDCSEDYGIDQQPSWNESGNLMITGHFRLDYKEELVRKLSIAAHEAGRLSNSQFVLRAFEKWGRDCVKHLEGDWAFAVYNKAEKSLFFAKDRLIGYSSLYYTILNQTIYFASDLAVFKNIPGLSLRVDYTSLVIAPFRLRAKEQGATILKNIFYVDSAQAIQVNAQCDLTISKYWDVLNHPAIRYKNENDYAEHFRELFSNGVKTRLHKKSSNGVLLSGGFDSTAVAAYAADQLREESRQLYSFTSVPAFPDQVSPAFRVRCNERPLVEHFVQHYPNIVPAYEDCADKPLMDMFIDGNGLSTVGLPRSNSNSLWMNTVFQKAGRNQVLRILSGQKGNTFISYHAPYLHYQMFRRMQWGTLVKEMACLAKGQGFLKAVRNNVLGPVKTQVLASINRQRYKTVRNHPLLRPGFFSDAVLDSLDWHKIKEELSFLPLYTPIKSSREYRLLLINADDPLVGMNSYIMAQQQGVEVADPTSDSRLAAFSINIPEEVWNNNGVRKKLYRQAFSGKVPAMILENPVRMLQFTDIAYRFTHENVGEELVKILSGDQKLSKLIDFKELTARVGNLRPEKDWYRKHLNTSDIIFQLFKLLYVKKYITLHQ